MTRVVGLSCCAIRGHIASPQASMYTPRGIRGRGGARRQARCHRPPQPPLAVGPSRHRKSGQSREWRRREALPGNARVEYRIFCLMPINLCPFGPSHEAAADRMQPQIWRMAARYWLLMEPIPGMAAALAQVGNKCPSCNTDLSGAVPLAVTNHLVSCATGGGTQRTARAFTVAVQRCCADVGVGSVRGLLGGLSSWVGYPPSPRTGRATR